MDRKNAQKVTLLERSPLCSPGSDKDTRHLVLDTSGLEASYRVGDSLAIYPDNCPEMVEKTLKSLSAKGTEQLADKKTGEWSPLREVLKKKVNIHLPSMRLLRLLKTHFPSDPLLKSCFEDPTKELLKRLIHEKFVFELLAQYDTSGIPFQELIDSFSPLLPRFYSIASSPKVHPGEIHLTVVMTEFEVAGKPRKGVCTDYLFNRVALDEPLIDAYIEPHKGFTLPEDPQAKIIMVGPGTGIAPFRAFLHERLHLGAKGANWLFFGERTEKHEFFYRDFFQNLVSSGHLTLDTAFSRESEKKVYVQHRMEEKGEELYRWLEEGAYFYVCGDKNRMARDVEATLKSLLERHGNLPPEGAQARLNAIRKEGRYLKDVY